ncbi:MAG: hypothetical protein IPG95_13565 [Saprospiraceae bacterium]|nr:hypothetical protein [Saprospiraceae bacterium]
MTKQTRRKFVLRILGILGGGILTIWFYRRKILKNTLFKTTVNPDISITAASSFDTEVCILTSKQLEGPFYFPSPERSNIIEDRIGKALDLKIQVLRYPDCTPIKNAVVELWQSDADGNYSGYPEEMTQDVWKLFMYFGKHGEKKPDGEYTTTPTVKTTYLRGLQKTDAEGWVMFNTIFPCWYVNRVPHIHFKIFIGKEEQLTSQFYFEKEFHDKIFTTEEPYKKYGICPITIQNDGAIALTPGNKHEGLLLKPVWNDHSALAASVKIRVAKS